MGGIVLMTGCSTDSQAASRPVPQFDANTKVIALTFDDGPSSTTPLVLDKLDQYGVVASFFVCGNNVGEQTTDTVKRAYDMGCEIHNHSKSHRDMTKLTEEQIRREITETSQRVEAITGEPTRFFRPPYIAVNDLMYDTVGMPFICGYGSNDWDDKVGVQERSDKVLAQIHDGSIILLHDAEGNTKTVEALDLLIPALQQDGYTLVTVSQLFEAKGVTPDTHAMYSDVTKD
ncbi:polysaccharide deacetylase family protein [Ruminococcus champanellensis]|nr:polysaccharide deacetylase family protein [Ruminococcus champanellensis]